MLSAKVICVFAFWLAGCSTTHGVGRNLESELSRVSQDVSTYPYNKDFKTCPISMDIAYLIDGSDSISPSEFDLEKTVVKVMAYFFGVMRLGTHNGVVVFSDTARTAIKFSDHEKFEPFRQAVKALVKPSGGTRIDVALEEAHDNLFMGGGGARASPDIPKVAVVFTDGVSGGQSLGTAVQQLRNKGILVFAVGINTDPTQIAGLRQLVPRSDLFFTARDFLDLYIRAGFISRLICQHIQNRGAPGPAGVQGTDGPPGLTGSPGAPGPVGDKGSMGPQGPKGLKGRKGATGDSGRPGTPGEDGFPGPTGPKGPDGQPGEPGAPGPRGPTGDTGNDGDPGPRGPKGFPGATGIKGDPGPNGANGSPGADGSDGAKGQQGLPGDIGASGPPGIDGTNGAPGSKGQPGNNGANGRPGPSGPAGPKGDPGPRGPDGNAGPVGDPGPAGQNGDNGVNGDPGNDGAPGPRGPTGPAGPKGFKGTSGDNGLNGFNGPVGPKGLPGGPGRDASQSITCMFRQSATGQLSMSCNDLSYTATDCSCSRGCGQWRVTDNGQTCRCLCNTYVPSSLYSVGVNCCKLQ